MLKRVAVGYDRIVISAGRVSSSLALSVYRRGSLACGSASVRAEPSRSSKALIRSFVLTHPSGAGQQLADRDSNLRWACSRSSDGIFSRFHAMISSGDEVDDSFEGMPDADGWMLVAGFGSLLSEKSSRRTFPDLRNFRVGKIRRWRRVFAHTAAIFFQRGIANAATGEISSLSCEPADDAETVVALFEVQVADQEAVKAYIEREHEFRFVAAEAEEIDGTPCRQLALICARFTDEEYKAKRCPPEEFERRYVQHGVGRVWRDDVLPCRQYLRHCVLAAGKLHPEAYENFLDNTFLADRKTTIRSHLEAMPGIMSELPPPELAHFYSG